MTVKLPFKEMKREGVDGYNLAEFPIMPLKYQATQCPESVHYEWEHKASDGNIRQCYLKVEYGSVKPNTSTDDTLLVICNLLNQQKAGASLQASCYQILKAKFPKEHPDQKRIKALIRDLEALMNLKIETNAIYNRKEKTWEVMRGRIVSSYVYQLKTKNGTPVERIRTFKKNGENVQSIEHIKELKRINLDPEFYQQFIKDSLPIDLRIYFALETPIAKRLYRIANKYTYYFKSHSEDLVQFCINKLGQNKKTILNMKYTSKLATKIRQYISRVNNFTDGVQLLVEKSKTESGYKITFKNTEVKTPVSDVIKGFSFSEKEAYKQLCKEGVYPNAAVTLMKGARKHFGKETVEFIHFSINLFHAFVKRQKSLNISENKKGGILYKMMCKPDVLSQFREYIAEKKKLSHSSNHQAVFNSIQELSAKMDMGSFLN